MSLKDKVESVDYELERARHDDTKAQLRQARQTVKAQTHQIEELSRVARIRESVDEASPPGWLTARPSDDQNRAIAVAMLSDLHLDEVVRPEEMYGINAYNRDIALYRLERFFTGVEKFTREYVKGVKIEGLVLPIGGDLVSGSIHDELRETNEVPLMATIKFWYPRIADGIRFLAEHFPQVHVVAVPGNHGRQTKKPRFKLAALDNADWLICSLLEQVLADDERITFQVPESLDVEYKIYNTRFLMNHGQTGGGQGIGGIWPPIMRLRAKKSNAHTFDWFNIGHWHQYIHGQGLTINGSLKGYDEFAVGSGFTPERPQQAFWLTTPENGVTLAAPIFCGGDPKAEGWGKKRSRHG